MDSKTIARVGILRDTLDLYCAALDIPTYLGVGMVISGKFLYEGDWNWSTHELGVKSPTAPQEALSRMSELVAAGAGLSERPITAVPEFLKGDRAYTVGVAIGPYLTTIWGLPKEHAKLLAILAYYSREEQRLHMHHSGMRVHSEHDFQKASAQTGGIRRDTENCLRVYNSMINARDGTQHIREIEWHPHGRWPKMRHLDFVVEQPSEFLQTLVCMGCGERDVLAAGKEGDPVGAVWCRANSDDSVLRVVARSSWVNVEKVT